VAPEAVGRVLSGRTYRRLWDEYAATLHRSPTVASDDSQPGAQGHSQPGAACDSQPGAADGAGPRHEGQGAAADRGYALRATAPAGALFTREALVDGRLFHEFVRHLPGILTGLGIIGTFAGLLTGLQGFDPSEDPAAARAGLRALLGGVEHAFYASAFAIGCAILLTLVEKLVIARCYQGADALAQAIDSLYAGGAGEDYLARLVHATEANARAIAGLKEALLSSQRPPAAAVSQAASGEGLGEALARVSEGLAAVAAQQQAAVQAEQQRHERLEAGAVRAWAGVSSEVTRLVQAVAASSSHTDAQVAAIERASAQAVERMVAGVQAMNAAAAHFADAGEAATRTAQRAADTGDELVEVARALRQACATVDRAFERYESARAGIDAQVASLAQLVDNARREAGLNRELLDDMQTAVRSLRGAQEESSRHLDAVNDKLVAAFETFGQSMKTQVAGVMRQTDQHTSTAMQHLLGMVQELGVALSRAKRA
jgi:hypothetical protein